MIMLQYRYEEDGTMKQERSNDYLALV